MKRSFTLKSYLAVFAAGIFCSAQVIAQPLSGLYTIDPALAPGGTNYQNFTAAAAALGANGVSAPVTFAVAAGTYNEQVVLNAISGVSATNTVTFSGDGATISANPTNPNDRAIIKLNGADYVHIEGLNITATGSSPAEYGYGIQLMNGADYNVISGCNIATTKTSNSSATPNYAGIVINSSDGAVLTQGNANCHFNTIRQNTISGGYYGIALVAQATTYTVNGNRIIDNSILDFYRTGIYMNGTVGTVVDNNDIARPGRPGTSFFQYFGMNLDGANSGLLVTRNKLHDPFGENATLSSSSAYAFYINGSAGDQNAGNLFANNLIYNMISNGIVGGFDITTSPYNAIINNTICIDDAGSGGFGFTKGISLTGANYQTIQNNNISLRRGGPGQKHCIYIGNTTGSVIDNNNYYVATGTTGFVGYFSGNRSTLTDLQAASGFDAASVSVDPQYTNAATGNFLPANTALQTGVPVPGINTDINGLGRNALTPTIGAYEINGVVLPVKMSPLRAGLQGPNLVRLSWSTFAEIGNAGFEIESSADGKSWSGIGFVATKATSGNSSNRIDYEFTDGLSLTALKYYRLQQLDQDGKRSLSNVVVVNPGNATVATDLRLYPNPAKDLLNITLTGADAAGLLTVNDLNGRQVMVVPVNGDHAGLDINTLLPGIYYLHFNNGHEHRVAKFVKSK